MDEYVQESAQGSRKMLAQSFVNAVRNMKDYGVVKGAKEINKYRLGLLEADTFYFRNTLDNDPNVTFFDSAEATCDLLGYSFDNIMVVLEPYVRRVETRIKMARKWIARESKNKKYKRREKK